MSKKILIVLGTRPEIIKLAPLILELKASELKESFIVASTSQHEELLDEQLNFWQINPDYFLTSYPFKGNLVRLLSHTLSGIQDILDQVKTIEYIIVQGDTNTSLACSNLAFLNQIKLIHIEAGLRSFDFKNPFPEEFNRSIASKVAYFHFAPTELSKTNLINEGIDPSKIMVVGNTVVDALHLVKKNNKETLNDDQKIVLITLHRRENIDKNYLTLIDIVCELAIEHPELNFIWITHPNCIESISSRMPHLENIKIQNHIPYNDFISLYASAKMVITDSGGVSEEAIHLGLPIVIFRLKTERLEAINFNYPMIVSIKKNEIISFFNRTLNQTNNTKYSYGCGNTSLTIMNWLNQEINSTTYETIIIGGGPAGTGLLLKALKDGNNNFFEKRIALIEKSSQLIKGNITQYKVNSDTFSDVFLECLEGSTHEFINVNELKNEIDTINLFKGQSIPLEKLDTYYNKLGALLKEHLESHEKCTFFMNSSVTKVIRKDNGTYQVLMAGQNQSINSKNVIIATGGMPLHINTESTLFDGTIALHNFSANSLHSDSILKYGIPENQLIKLKKKSKIVILGGSHSAFSVAHLLLTSKEQYNFESGDIKIWCNSLPKIYFPTREDAIAHGYFEFTENDFCPVTKKLYRLAGLRMDGRELYMKMLGLNGTDMEKCVDLKTYTDQQTELEMDLNEATLIILANGYKLNIFPFYTEKNNLIKFEGEETNHWVNQNCEMLDDLGEIIPNLFATGLATGFIPKGELGGEPSFDGQTNGIWYYQNAIAERIINNLQNENSSNIS